MLTTTTSMTPVASSIQRKATLCAFTASLWTARRLDKNITIETNQRYHAAADAGRFNKLLVQATDLKEITSLYSAAKDLYNRYTSPWAKGVGLLPNTLYSEFTNQFRVINQKFDDAADRFERAYPAILAAAPGRLNGMFNPSDYPAVSKIRSKFSLSLRFSTVPDAGDFRSDALDADTIEDIRKEIAASVQAQEREFVAGVYRQIGEIVGHMAERLKEYDAYDPTKKDRKTGKVKKVYFKDSLVENVKELAALLPAFNLTDDPKLAKLTARIKDELTLEFRTGIAGQRRRPRGCAEKRRGNLRRGFGFYVLTNTGRPTGRLASIKTKEFQWNLLWPKLWTCLTMCQPLLKTSWRPTLRCWKAIGRIASL